MTESSAPERWLPVPGHEGWYEVSDLGRVRSVHRTVVCRNGRVIRRRAQLLVATLNDQGRPHVTLRKPGSRVHRKVHSLVLSAFVGPRADGMEACHGDGNPANNRLENLRWDTRRGNRLDAVRHGTHPMTARSRCPRSHRLEAPNLVQHVAEKGRRACLACRRATVNAQDLLAAGKVIDIDAAADRHYQQIMSGTARGRMADRTRCPRKHPLVQPNLVLSALAKGRRSCLACARAASNEHSAKRHGRSFDRYAMADLYFVKIMQTAGRT